MQMAFSLLAFTLLPAGNRCVAEEPPAERGASPPAPFGFDLRELPFAPAADFAKQFGIPSADDFLGGLTDEQRAAVERMPVSAREERVVGNRAVESHLAMLRAQNIDLITRGREFDYLQRLVTQIHPHMENRGRYRQIRVVLADTKEIDARSFPPNRARY